MTRRRIKLVLAAAGVILAVVALYLDDQRVMWGAIAALAGALSIRFLPGTRDDRQ